MRFIPHLALYFPITAMLLQNLKMTPFFLLPLVALLEGPKSMAGFVVSKKQIAQSANLLAQDAVGLDTRVGHVVSQLIVKHNCFNLIYH